MARKDSTVNAVAATFALLAAAAVAWVLLRSSAAAPPALLAMCPVSGDGRLGLVVGARASGKSSTTTSARFLVVDVKTGSSVADVAMGSWKGVETPACLGTAGGDRVWLRVPGETTLEARTLSNGTRVLAGADLVKRNAALSVGIQDVGWDFDHELLTISTRDARRFSVSHDFLVHAYDGQVGMFTMGHEYADSVLKTDVVTFYRGGAAGLVLHDKRRITLRGEDRVHLIIGDSAMPGDDFYHPHLLRAPDGSVEIPGPPSVLVAEETLVGSLRYRLSRVALDGTRRWSVDPGSALPAAWRYRPVPWTLADGGAVALHVGGAEVMGVDVASGAVRWRRSYAEK